MPTEIPAVSPSVTRVEMTQIVLPEHTNAMGTIFGGQVAAWIDISGAIAAQRFCRSQVVTVSIDQLEFLHPIQRGHIAIFRASVNAAWHHSMEVGVRVEGEDPLTGLRTHTASAFVTFVALDEAGHTRQVPTVLISTEEEADRQRAADARRVARLAQRRTPPARGV